MVREEAMAVPDEAANVVAGPHSPGNGRSIRTPEPIPIPAEPAGWPTYCELVCLRVAQLSSAIPWTRLFDLEKLRTDPNAEQLGSTKRM
jgi:hypothetical protein